MSTRGRGGSYFPNILLNEIKKIFSQLAKRSSRVLPADLCTDHAYYVINQRSTGEGTKLMMAVEGGIVTHYNYILVILYLEVTSWYGTLFKVLIA